MLGAVCLMLMVGFSPLMGEEKAMPEVASLVKQAKEAMAAGDLAGALRQFEVVHKQIPENNDYLHNIALLASQLDQRPAAMDYLRLALSRAVAGGRQGDAQFYAQELQRLATLLPAELEQALQRTAGVPREKESAVTLWQKAKQEEAGLRGQKRYKEALAAARQAHALVLKELGPEHWLTVVSQRDVALRLGEVDAKNSEILASLTEAWQGAGKVLGSRHPETLALLTRRAEAREAAGGLDEALQDLMACHEGFIASLGENSLPTLAARSRLAGFLADRDDPRAGELFAQACPGYETLLTRHHPKTADCRLQWGRYLANHDQAPKAAGLIREARASLREVLGADHPETLVAGVEEAETLRLAGDARGALAGFQDLVRQAEATGMAAGWPEVHQAQRGVARALLDLGRYAEAVTLLTRLDQEASASMGKDHPDTLETRVLLAEALDRAARFHEAEEVYVQVLAGYRQRLGESHPAIPAVLTSLGQSLEKQGLLEQAEVKLKDAVAISRQRLGPTHATTLAAINNLALLHESQGLFDQAIPLYEEVIRGYQAKLGPDHVHTAAVINNLGFARLIQGEPGQAVKAFQEALAIWQAKLGENHPITLKGLNNLGRALPAGGAATEGEKTLRQALDQRRTVLGEGHADTIRSLHDLGALLANQGRRQEAQPLLEKALQLANRHLPRHHPYALEILETLARLHEAQAHLEGSLALRVDLLERRTEFLYRVMWVTGENAREGYIQLHRPELDAFLSLLTRLDPARAGGWGLTVGLHRKGLLLHVANEIQRTVALARDPGLAAMADELATTRKAWASQLLAHSDAPDSRGLASLEARIHDLEGRLGAASARFRQVTSRPGLKEVEAGLAEGNALVDYLIYRQGDTRHLLAAMMKKEKGVTTRHLVPLGEMETIEKEVMTFRRVVRDEESEEPDIARAGRKVWNLVWQPLTPFLAEMPVVYVVPDGVLHILPFPSLVLPDGSYLIHKLALHVLGSSRDLLNRRPPASQGGLVVMAGPDYDVTVAAAPMSARRAVVREDLPVGDPHRQSLRALAGGLRGLKFAPLPGAEQEGRHIAQSASASGRPLQQFYREEATEGALLQVSRSPEVLHLATHGFFLEADSHLKNRLLSLQRGGQHTTPPPGDNPLLRSGLAFAGINRNAPRLGEMDTDNDGILTAMEVLDLDLQGTRLAVLSACETGLGAIHEGEGVYGLRRAFQEAGAQAVISSLWEVSDAGTQALMSALYQELTQGVSPYDALRKAQLGLLKSPVWKMPHVWAAFMLVGE